MEVKINKEIRNYTESMFFGRKRQILRLLNNPGGNPSPVRRMEITNPFYWKSRFR